MWVCQLNDMAEQAYHNGRRYSDVVWHEYFKSEFLPEETDPEIDRLVKDPQTYKKWDIGIKGDRILNGSTTELSIYGFSQYLMQLEAFGASLGVEFSSKPGEWSK